VIKDRVAFDLPHYEGLLAGHYVREAGYSRRRPGGTDDWLLIATLAGEGQFGEQISHPETLTLLPPGTTHDYGTNSRWELLWVHFHPPADWIDLLQWPQAHFSPPEFGPVETAFREVIRLAPAKKRLAMNVLERLLLLADAARPTSANLLDERIRTVTGYIQEHLDQPLAVERLARLVHLSPSRFAHLFRAEIGLAPMEYVIQRRIERARLLLARTNLSVAEVASEIGMEPFQFSSRFKAQTGISPRAYRNAQTGADALGLRDRGG